MRERPDDSRESEAMDVEERRAGVELSGNHDLMSNEQLDRYSRQIILKEIGIEGQRRLLNAKVLVVGAGGLGSPAEHLPSRCRRGHDRHRRRRPRRPLQPPPSGAAL